MSESDRKRSACRGEGSRPGVASNPFGSDGSTCTEWESARADVVEAMLDSWHVPDMGPDLRRRLVSIPALEPAQVQPVRRLMQAWLAAGGLVTAAALGAVVGLSPVGQTVERAVGLDPAPEDELVAMLDGIMEDTLQ